MDMVDSDSHARVRWWSVRPLARGAWAVGTLPGRFHQFDDPPRHPLDGPVRRAGQGFAEFRSVTNRFGQPTRAAPLLAADQQLTAAYVPPAHLCHERDRQLPRVAGTAQAATGKIKLLLVKPHRNNGHPWQGYEKAINDVFAKLGDLEVKTGEDITAETLKDIDVVCVNGPPTCTPEESKILYEYVQKGGGLCGLHATWFDRRNDVFWRLMGGCSNCHGLDAFMLRIDDKTHPITAGMEDFVVSGDETYWVKHHPQVKVHHLMHVDRGEEQQSMGWVHEIGRGRVFCTTLFHRPLVSCRNVNMRRLLARGIYWAAGRQPRESVKGGK